jgi:hypothetical protein
MTNSSTPEQGTGIAEAAAVFENILAGNPANQDPEQSPPEDPADEDQAEAQGTESTDETPDEAEEVEEGAEDEEAAANDEDAEPAPLDLESLVPVKIDGKEEMVPLKEALNGYQRHADYSRHIQVVAAERKALQAEREQYAQLLPVLEQQAMQMLHQEPDWERLYAEDPLEYVKLKEDWRTRQEQMQVLQAEQQRVAYLQQQEQAQQLQERVKQGREELINSIPAWRDSAKWEADRKQIRQSLVKEGFSEEEISQAYDPRAVRLAYKAMRYDQLMARKPQPVRQEGPKPAKPGVAQSMPTRKHTDLSKAKMRLSKTGSVKDAATIFESLL